MIAVLRAENTDCYNKPPREADRKKGFSTPEFVVEESRKFLIFERMDGEKPLGSVHVGETTAEVWVGAPSSMCRFRYKYNVWEKGDGLLDWPKGTGARALAAYKDARQQPIRNPEGVAQ